MHDLDRPPDQGNARSENTGDVAHSQARESTQLSILKDKDSLIPGAELPFLIGVR